MGHIAGPDWLPVAPNGSSFGPAPATLAARQILLNQTFADAWRVTKITSLFDYAPGTSTADFTFPGWPPDPGKPCIVPGHAPVEPMQRERAIQLCAIVRDKAANENCIFDVVATGEAGFAAASARTLQLRDTAGKFAPFDFCGPLLPPPNR